jgi:ubiquinone/menaquinone biosynthesis C-methylase UbiE
MSASTPGSYFDGIASSYDSQAQRGLPRYDEMISELVRTLPERAEQILELGCGTGALTFRLLERFPVAAIEVVDASKPMLEVLQGRVPPEDRSRLRVVNSPFEELDRRAGSFDLVTSSMSLHHVVDKQAFYERIRSWLRPGGFLVFADELIGAVPYVQARLWDRWIAFAKRPDGLTTDELDDCLAHVETYDHYETLADQLGYLSGAGFAPVDCVWRYLNYAVFVAVAR